MLLLKLRQEEDQEGAVPRPWWNGPSQKERHYFWIAGRMFIAHESHLRGRKGSGGEGGEVRQGREVWSSIRYFCPCHQMASDALWPLSRQYEELEGPKAEVREDFHQTHRQGPCVLPTPGSQPRLCRSQLRNLKAVPPPPTKTTDHILYLPGCQK